MHTHRIPNSVYCPSHMIHNARACNSSQAAAVGRRAAAAVAAASRTMSVGTMIQMRWAMSRSAMSTNPTMTAKTEKSAAVAVAAVAAGAKCIDRSAISIYGTNSQHTYTHTPTHSLIHVHSHNTY